MSTEAHNAFAGQGAVLLDIGGDVGALVVRMPEDLVGVEVEIRPGHRHVAVVGRPVAGGMLPSLVYDGVAAGDYVLGLKGDPTPRLGVTVRGGAVTEADWR